MDFDLTEKMTSKVAKVVKYTYQWPKDNFSKQILIACTYTFLVFSIIFILVGYCIYISEQNNDRYNAQVDFVVKSNSLITAIESINLCLSSKKENNSNSEWYCNHAMDLFKFNIHRNTPYEQEIINKKSYELMLISINNELRTLEYKKLISNKNKTFYEAFLDGFFTNTGMLIFAISIAGTFIIQMLFFKRKKQNLREE
jgi:hypothetical protein